MYTAPQTPRSIGGVIDDAIELFKASFRHCWPVALVCGIVAGAVGAWLQWSFLPVAGARPDPAAVLAMYRSPGVWTGYLVLIAWSTLIYLMLTGIVLAVSRGAPDSGAMAQLGPALRRLPAALIAMVLMGLGVLCGIVLLIVPGIWLGVRWTLTLVAVADQEAGPTRAMGVSWQLVKGHWWRTLTIISVMVLLMALLAMLLGAVFGFVGAAMRLDAATTLIGTQVMQAASQVISLPALVAAWVATYHDLRLRKEGGDLEARLGGLKSAPT
jgi:hypothetical protein